MNPFLALTPAEASAFMAAVSGLLDYGPLYRDHLCPELAAVLAGFEQALLPTVQRLYAIQQAADTPPLIVSTPAGQGR